MPHNLRSRLDRIARTIGEAVGRWVVVWTSSAGDPSIERVGPHNENLKLRVPDGEGNPTARLTDEQRAAIGPADRIIVVRHVCRPPGGEADAP